jgi:hypothetical protein
VVVADLRLEVSMNPMAHSRNQTLLLVAGAGLGIVLAACGLLSSRPGSARAMRGDAVASVNRQPIGLAEYRRALAGLANDRRDGLTAADRRRVLERLIDEELLIQRGLELGLAHSDRRIRSDLTSAVIAVALAERRDAVPSQSDVETFYADHRDTFATSARMRLQQIFFRVDEPAAEPGVLERAREAVRRARAGETVAGLRAELGDPEVAPLPDMLLPPAKLLDYLGPTALGTALSLAPGEVSEPVRSGQGVHVLWLVERGDAAARPLADVRSEVAGELARRRDEEALRGYLDHLRGAAQIQLSDGAR